MEEGVGLVLRYEVTKCSDDCPFESLRDGPVYFEIHTFRNLRTGLGRTFPGYDFVRVYLAKGEYEDDKSNLVRVRGPTDIEVPKTMYWRFFEFGTEMWRRDQR